MNCQKQNKMGNKSCRCLHSHIHRSIFEAKVCNDLHVQYPKSEIKTEVKFPMVIGGDLICNHYMDFVIDDKIAVEAKGFPTPVWKIKSKLFKALYTDYEYEIRYYKR